MRVAEGKREDRDRMRHWIEMQHGDGVLVHRSVGRLVG